MVVIVFVVAAEINEGGPKDEKTFVVSCGSTMLLLSLGAPLRRLGLTGAVVSAGTVVPGRAGRTNICRSLLLRCMTLQPPSI
jgi:hypothetical protein